MNEPLVVRVRPFPVPQVRRTVAADAVHVWEADLDHPPLPPADLLAVLTPAEYDRHARTRQPHIAARFAHARGLLRHLLAGYLDVSPERVPLVVTADGKPEVPGGPFFNLSHSAGRLLVAVAAVPIGVDVERVRVVSAADDLVRRWFHPAEREQYERLPAELRPAAFLRGWTCKEALLKGIGCGSRELAGCVVELDPQRRPAVRLSPDRGAWQLACWQTTNDFAAAVAVQSSRSLKVIGVGAPGIEPGT